MRKQCHIYTRKDADIRDRQNWPEQHKWLLENLIKFQTKLKPFLKQLGDELPDGQNE